MNNMPIRVHEEKAAKTYNGMAMLILIITLFLISCGLLVIGILWAAEVPTLMPLGIVLIVITGIYLCIVGPIQLCGLKVIQPNEAIVLTLFGKYVGSITEPGFYYVNPFVTSVNPASSTSLESQSNDSSIQINNIKTTYSYPRNRKISLKAMTLDNEKQKINDLLGNPIYIGIVVIWRVVNTAKAVFNVDNYKEYIAIQCDSALRDIVRLYPYDMPDDSDGDVISLRASSNEIALKLKEEIQSKVDIAGLEIMEARITHLSYAPEIAAAMLQRQQASAIIDARKLIVEGAVGMVHMALEDLKANGVVSLDEERKAAMVSNLLVVLCGSREAQPIINSGSLY